MQTLEQRLQRIEDRFAINDLLVQYAVLLDDSCFEAVGQLFTADGVFASPNSTTVGRDAVVANFRLKHEPYPVTVHEPVASTAYFIDDDHARGTVIGYAELANPNDMVVTSLRYHDDYVRIDGAWRFASRYVLSVYGMTIDEVVAGRVGSDMRKRWPGRPVAESELPDRGQRFPGYLVAQ